MAQLHERFQGDSAIVNRFTLLLPKVFNRASFVEIEELKTIQFFSSRGVTVTALETELLRWESYWQLQEENKRPGNVIETLRVASDLVTYPTLHGHLVKIICNYPHHNCHSRTLIQQPQVH